MADEKIPTPVPASTVTAAPAEGISAAPAPSIWERLKSAVTEGIPSLSTRTSENPKYGEQQIITPEAALTPEEQKAHPVATGIGEFAGSLTSPQNVAIMGASGGLGSLPGAAGKVLPQLVSGYFSEEMLRGAYNNIPQIKAAADQGDTGEVKRLLTHMALNLTAGIFTGKHVLESEPVAAVKEHLAETGKTFVEGVQSEAKAALEAKAPEGSLEAGFAKIGGKKVASAAKAKAVAAVEPAAAIAEKVPTVSAEEVEPKISTDSNGIKWAEGEGGVRVSIPKRITDAELPEYAKTKLAEQSAMQAKIKAAPISLEESGGKQLTPPDSDVAPYHPALQAVADKLGTTFDATGIRGGGSFITPDGQFIHLRGADHPRVIEGYAPEWHQQLGERVKAGEFGKTTSLDTRVPFVNDTGAVRTRYEGMSPSGPRLGVTVPGKGVTPEQVNAIQQAVGAMGRNGNLLLERADISAATKDALSTHKEFVSPRDVEPMLKKIGAHPDQAGERVAPAKVASSEVKPKAYEVKPKAYELNADEEPEGVAPNKTLQESANKYATSKGMEPIDHSPVEQDPARAKEIARQYHDATDAPNDPQVAKAYDALKTETMEQFHHLRDDLGLKFEPQEDDPYQSAGDMMDDVRKNNRLKVFTSSGTGPEHPLSEIDPETGESYNTIFRWVHDAMGHAAGGFDFSENGEKSATEAHAQMYGDKARPAMRAETEGQTSWFFHNPDVESGTKAVGDFAPQKATILPENTGTTLSQTSDELHVPKELQYSGPAETRTHEIAHILVGDELGFPQVSGYEGVKSHLHPNVPNNTTRAWVNLDFSKAFQSPENFVKHIGDMVTTLVSGGVSQRLFHGTPIETNIGMSADIKMAQEWMTQAKMSLEEQRAQTFKSITHAKDLLTRPATQDIVRQYSENRPSGTPKAYEVDPETSIKMVRDHREALKNANTGLEGEGSTGGESGGPVRQGTGDAGANAPTGASAGVGVSQADVAGRESATSIKPEAGVTTEWHQTAGELATKNAAGGIDPRTGKLDTEGKGVEVMPELRQPIDHVPTREDFQQFYEQHKEIFDKNPELRVGWDTNAAVPGGHELNIGAVGPDAARVAKKLDQIAAYDIAKGENIETGGEGKRTEFPNYSLEERMKDLRGENQSDTPGFEHISKEVHDNLEPDEREYIKGDKTQQRNLMAQYHKIQPSVEETTNAMQAGAALGGWWKRYIDVFHNLTDAESHEVANTVGPSHAEVLKQWHAALSANKSVGDANNLAWHSYADWLDAGKPLDRKSINDIVLKNGAQPEGATKKGNAAISDTLGRRGKVVREGIDTSKIFNLVNSPEMRGERPFTGDAFSDDVRRNPLMGKGLGYRKVPSMGATVAGKGNLNRLVIDTHINDFYGQSPKGPAARYLADSVHLRQAAKALGLAGGEGQEQLWGTVLGIKTLLKEGLTPAEAGGTLSARIIQQIGKDYAEVIANDPEITAPGGGLDRLKEKYGIGRGSAGVGEAHRKALGSSAGKGQPAGSETAVSPTLTGKTAERIRGQISDSRIKTPAVTEGGVGGEEGDTSFDFGANVKPKPSAPKPKAGGKMNAMDLIKALEGLKKSAK